MRPAIDYDLVALGYTTADIRQLARPRSLEAGLRELFGLEDLRVNWLPEGARSARKASWSSLSDEKLSDIYGRGAINLTDPEGQRFDAGLEWHRVPRSERQAFLTAHGYRQNLFTLHTDRHRLKEPVFREKYLELCKQLASAFEVSYLIVHNPAATPARLPTSAGLGAGLPGVYWVNVFGKPFLDILGADRLLKAPVAHAERLDSGHVLLVADDALLDPARAQAAAAPLRAYVGEQFFARATPPAAQPGVFSLFSLPGMLRKQGQSFTSTSGNAQVTPSFDYGAILLED